MSKRKNRVEITITTDLGTHTIEDTFRIYPCRHIHWRWRAFNKKTGGAFRYTGKRRFQRIKKGSFGWDILKDALGSPKLSQLCNRANKVAKGAI